MRAAALLLPLLVLSACKEPSIDPLTAGPEAPEDAPVSATTGGAEYAIARILPLGESSISGTVSFTQQADGVLVEYDLAGLELGEHGFHVHEGDDCGPGDDGAPGGAAGGHFDPYGAPHGGPDGDREMRHVGDLGNVTSVAAGARTGGVARGEILDQLISLSGPTSVVGRAMMVHRSADDLESQPSGAAGDRFGCGIIGLATPPAPDMAPSPETDVVAP